eukprot:SM000278S10011  [mRNA]  locus=s278:52288:58153:+ [translate_table: standard]
MKIRDDGIRQQQGCVGGLRQQAAAGLRLSLAGFTEFDRVARVRLRAYLREGGPDKGNIARGQAHAASFWKWWPVAANGGQPAAPPSGVLRRHLAGGALRSRLAAPPVRHGCGAASRARHTCHIH